MKQLTMNNKKNKKRRGLNTGVSVGINR